MYFTLSGRKGEIPNRFAKGKDRGQWSVVRSRKGKDGGQRAGVGRERTVVGGRESVVKESEVRDVYK